jgi:hypothetical protein
VGCAWKIDCCKLICVIASRACCTRAASSDVFCAAQLRLDRAGGVADNGGVGRGPQCDVRAVGDCRGKRAIDGDGVAAVLDVDRRCAGGVVDGDVADVHGIVRCQLADGVGSGGKGCVYLHPIRGARGRLVDADFA